MVGGAGYIGGAVTDLLLETEHSVRVYDALLYEEDYRKPIDFIYGDIRDRDRLKKHLDWADAVVWMAALVADQSCELYPELAKELNDASVKWLAQNFDGRIIFPSTCLVYAIANGLLDEQSRTDPSTIYTKSKLAAEGHLKNRNALIFRLSTVFGIGDLFSRIRLDLVVNLLTAKAVLDKKMIVFGGQQSRPFIHVQDVAKAVVDNIDTVHTGIFNLHFENMTILNLAKKIQASIPDANLEIKPSTVSKTGDYQMSSDKARRILGFNPKYSIEQGIEQVKAVIEDHRLKDITNPRYSNEAFLKAYPPT